MRGIVLGMMVSGFGHQVDNVWVTLTAHSVHNAFLHQGLKALHSCYPGHWKLVKPAHLTVENSSYALSTNQSNSFSQIGFSRIECVIQKSDALHLVIKLQ